MNMMPLAIHTDANSPLIPVDVIALPVDVETAAYLAVLGDELHLLINNYQDFETLQFRIAASRQLEPLPAIPMTVADVTACRATLYISGSNPSGMPVIGNLAANGRLNWQFSPDDQIPALWPVPICTSSPMLVWQTNAGHVEMADISHGQLGRHTTHVLDESPFAIAADDQGIWLASANPNAINIKQLQGKAHKIISITTPNPSDISMTCYNEDIRLAWNYGTSSFASSFNTKRSSFTTPQEYHHPPGTTGIPRVVSGEYPVIWIQCLEDIGNETPYWQSMLFVDNVGPLLIDGLVHDVVQWGERLAVLGSTELYLFEYQRQLKRDGLPHYPDNEKNSDHLSIEK